MGNVNNGFPPAGDFPSDSDSPQPSGFPQPGGFPQASGFPEPGGFPQPPGFPQASGFPQQPGGFPGAPAVCPACGSDAAVKTVAELFEIMKSGPAAFLRGSSQAGQNWNDPGYDPYHPEADIARGTASTRRGSDYDSVTDSLAEDIGGAVLGAAMGFLGRKIAKKMQQAFEEKVVPAMQQQAARSSGQWLPSQAEQDAIAGRYPELRGCLRDQVVFLAGGTRTVPLSEIQLPVTLASADNLVARLR